MTQVLPTAGSATAGGTLSVTNTVQNPGGLPAGSFAIAFRLSVNTIYGDGDDVVISTTRGGVSLAAGASSSATSRLAIPLTTPPGTYFVCAKADSGGVVTEADESNNTLCSSSTITVP